MTVWSFVIIICFPSPPSAVSIIVHYFIFYFNQVTRLIQLNSRPETRSDQQTWICKCLQRFLRLHWRRMLTPLTLCREMTPLAPHLSSSFWLILESSWVILSHWLSWPVRGLGKIQHTSGFVVKFCRSNNKAVRIFSLSLAILASKRARICLGPCSLDFR